MQKLFILLSLLLAASCGDDGHAPRIAAALGDAELDGVEYAPLHGSLRPGGYMQAVPVEAGYDIPDDGVNVVRLLFTSAEGYTEEWSLLLFPGERLRIGGLLHDDEGNAELEIRGSELYEAMERENTPFGPQIRRLTTLNRIVEAGGQLDEQQQLELDSLTAWNHAYRIERIRNHPESPATAAYLYEMALETGCDSLFRSLWAGLPAGVSEGRYKPLFDLMRPAEAGETTTENTTL